MRLLSKSTLSLELAVNVAIRLSQSISLCMNAVKLEMTCNRFLIIQQLTVLNRQNHTSVVVHTD